MPSNVNNSNPTKGPKVLKEDADLSYMDNIGDKSKSKRKPGRPRKNPNNGETNKRKAGRPKGSKNLKKNTANMNPLDIKIIPAPKRSTEIQDIAVVEANDIAGIASGLSKVLKRSPNSQGRLLISQSTTELELCEVIKSYFRKLEDLPVIYTRNQMIQDLIILMKNGNAGVSKTLVDLLGFNSTNENFEINMINFKDINVDDGNPPID